MPKGFYRGRIRFNQLKSSRFGSTRGGGKRIRSGSRNAITSDTYVGKKKRTHIFVGSVEGHRNVVTILKTAESVRVCRTDDHWGAALGAIRLWIDPKLLHTVRYNPFRGSQEPCSLGHISPGVLKGVDEQFLFEAFHRLFQRE